MPPSRKSRPVAKEAPAVVASSAAEHPSIAAFRKKTNTSPFLPANTANLLFVASHFQDALHPVYEMHYEGPVSETYRDDLDRYLKEMPENGPTEADWEHVYASLSQTELGQMTADNMEEFKKRHPSIGELVHHVRHETEKPPTWSPQMAVMAYLTTFQPNCADLWDTFQSLTPDMRAAIESFRAKKDKIDVQELARITKYIVASDLSSQ